VCPVWSQPKPISAPVDGNPETKPSMPLLPPGGGRPAISRESHIQFWRFLYAKSRSALDFADPFGTHMGPQGKLTPPSPRVIHTSARAFRIRSIEMEIATGLLIGSKVSGPIIMARPNTTIGFGTRGSTGKNDHPKPSDHPRECSCGSNANCSDGDHQHARQPSKMSPRPTKPNGLDLVHMGPLAKNGHPSTRLVHINVSLFRNRYTGVEPPTCPGNIPNVSGPTKSNGVDLVHGGSTGKMIIPAQASPTC
jgi:hypothetical protein